jgi:hypothetical protein
MLCYSIPRGFLILFHIGIWSPSTIYPQLNLLHSPSSIPLIPPTVPILQSCLLFLIFELMFKRVSQCVPIVSVLYFGSFNPFNYSPLSFYLPPLFCNSFQYISLYSLPSQMLCFMILLIIKHSFSFPYQVSLRYLIPFMREEHSWSTSLKSSAFTLIYVTPEFWREHIQTD